MSILSHGGGGSNGKGYGATSGFSGSVMTISAMSRSASRILESRSNRSRVFQGINQKRNAVEVKQEESASSSSF